MATFTLSVFGIDNRIFFTGVSLEMSRSHSSLQLCLEYGLYERAMGVKPVFLTSNHSDSDQSKIKDGDVHKTESLITFWHDKSPIEPQVISSNLLNLGGERNIWIASNNTKLMGAAPVENWLQGSRLRPFFESVRVKIWRGRTCASAWSALLQSVCFIQRVLPAAARSRRKISLITWREPLSARALQ